MVTIFLWYQIISYKMICKIIKCLSWLCFKCTSPSIQTVGHVFPLKDSCTYQNLYGSAKLLFSTEPRYYKGQIEHCMYRDIALRSEYLHFFLSNLYSIRQIKKNPLHASIWNPRCPLFLCLPYYGSIQNAL